LSLEYEAFLKQWENQPRHANCAFIADGIIDESRWSTSKRKTMLLLKEAYTFDDESHKNGFDLRVLIRDVWKGPKYKMWWTAAYWCYAVHNATYTSPIFPNRLLKNSQFYAQLTQES